MQINSFSLSLSRRNFSEARSPEKHGESVTTHTCNFEPKSAECDDLPSERGILSFCPLLWCSCEYERETRVYFCKRQSVEHR